MRRHRSRVAILVVLAAAGALLAALAALGRDGTSAPRAVQTRNWALALPNPAKPAFRVRTPRPLTARAARFLWAPVLRPVVARTAPAAQAPPVAQLEVHTPEETTNIVLVLRSATGSGGGLWTLVRLPVLPNNSTGWVPRRSLGGLVGVATHLVVDRERFRATLFRGGRPIFSAPVGVGTGQTPTPRGEFYVRNQLTSYRSPFYGPVAFGTSARSETLTDWPQGGYVGIHGTNAPELLPGAVSHGCIRMRNADILRLASLMPIGTPLTIR